MNIGPQIAIVRPSWPALVWNPRVDSTHGYWLIWLLLACCSVRSGLACLGTYVQHRLASENRNSAHALSPWTASAEKSWCCGSWQLTADDRFILMLTWFLKFRSNDPMILWIQCSCGSAEADVQWTSSVLWRRDVSVGTHDCNVDRVTVAKPMMGSQQVLHEMCDI